MKPRRPARIALSLLLLALAAAACSSGGAAGPSARPRGSSDRIIEAELADLSQLSAYEAIQRLRPRWLQSRTGLLPTVHVDGSVRSEGSEVLRSLRVSEVQELQFMSAPDATTRFGTNYNNGLILVTTKR